MIITIGGKAGAGKSTCTKLLSQKLGYEIISIGNIKREIAAEMGISIHEFNLLGELPENIKKFDHQYEEYQKSLPLESNVILDSRLSYWCQPFACNVFLDVEEHIGAERILQDKRVTDNHKTIEQTIENNKERNKKDSERYIKLYNTNPRDISNYDLVIDTTYISPEEVVETIIKTYQAKIKGKK